MVLKHVVVDGSNIATEGRETPSLTQLDEAVRAFNRDYAPDIVTVVVDATFPNRIDSSERQLYEDGLAAGELITPPAGAIGRGDEFVLEIADRAEAVVLSNDSFQEFHGQYAWLFEKGRLIGGKPVPHVGWVFMDRSPVRGPASRRALSEAKRAEKRPARKAAGTARAAAKTKARKQTQQKATAETETAAPKKAAPKKARARGVVAPKKARAKKTATAHKKASIKKTATKKTATRKTATKKTATKKTATADKKAAAERTAEKAAAPTAHHADQDDAYNDRTSFDRFVNAHPVGSDVQAIVERFGSHGAHVVSGDVRAYVPLKNLADPPPRSAKDVLKLGETREFVVAAIDHAKRGVDLALPGAQAAEG